MPDTYESRVAQGESELERAYLQQSLAKIDEWLEHTTGLIPIAAIMVVRNRVDSTLRAAQAAQVDKEKLEQRVKELELPPMSMHKQLQAKQGEVDLWEKRYNEAISYIQSVWDYLEKQHMEIAMREVFAQGLREMEENVSSAIALAIHLDHLITPKGESDGS
ncbi:MAG: hypothetical protein PHE17_19390 [Thiothrix sp.]|uniref:hypothetical protein n=1 Tax=Thiothrix sp. TaxID=1032 RepID=UPI00261DFB26|nr:hypothetical protein [Thiothrix sp.]MDD5395192.1 hypothetical protein [Thiothrix sp.]